MSFLNQHLPPVLWHNHHIVRRRNQLSSIIAVSALGCLIALLPIRLAGVIVAASGLILLILINPRLAFYLLIPAIPFNSVVQVNISGVNIGPMEALLGLMLMSWLLQMMVQQQVIVPRPPLLAAYLLLLGAIGLSWLNTVSLKSSLIETIKWLEMLALALFVWANFNRKAIPWIIGMLLLSGLAEASLGLYQFFFKVGPEGFLLFGGRFLRAYGTFRQPNPYAGYLGLILPLGLSLSLWLVGIRQGRRQEARSTMGGLRGKQFFLSDRVVGLTFFGTLGITVMLIAGLFASQSRGAWLGFLGAATITVLLSGGRWRLALILAGISGTILISLGGLAYLPTTLTERFVDALPFLTVVDIERIRVTDANFAIIERLAHWQAALEMWRDQFWLGVGIGNYEIVYPGYAIGEWLDPLGHAHNYILNMGAETGFIGLLGYLTFWGWVIAYTVRLLLKTRPGQVDRAILAGCLGIIVHLHIHNFLDNLYVQGMYLHVAIILSLITLLSRGTSSHNVSRTWPKQSESICH